jgi:hypothetical protein
MNSIATNYLACVDPVWAINRGCIIMVRQLLGFTPGSAADFLARGALTSANVVWC